MTTLEATVEIVKAALNPGGAATGSTGFYLSVEEHRKKFLDGIEQLYKKLDQLNQAQNPTSKQYTT